MVSLDKNSENPISDKRERCFPFGKRLLIALVSICGLIGWYAMIKMPGNSYHGPLMPLSETELRLKNQLVKDLTILAEEVGERNLLKNKGLLAAAEFLESTLRNYPYKVSRHQYTVDTQACYNIVGEKLGTTKTQEIVVVGAHYDSLYGTAGANDNGSGVVALLAIARACADISTARTIRFVGFVNEEPPYFQTESMGSWVYAKQCRSNGDNIIGMISLETIGYYSDQKDSQQYPPPFSLFYPSVGNFIAFVGNLKSAKLLKNSIRAFRKQTKFPSEGVATWSVVPGIGWSDHWAFWQEGYPAFMVTDTAPFRYPYYHTVDDTVDKIDFDRFARVVNGLQKMVMIIAKD